MGDGLRLALTTLTVLPVRGPAALDRRTAGRGMALAPLVGLLLGTAAALVLVCADAATQGGPLLPAVLAMASLAALTRGLHLDGLADTADGLGSYLPAEQARRVMKDPDVGALGLVAVVLTLAVQTAALAACAAAGRGVPALVLAVVLGRVSVAQACTPATPAPGAGGLGAAVAGTVPARVPPLLWSATVLLAAAWTVTAGTGDGAPGGTGPAAAIGTLLQAADGVVRVLLAAAAGSLAARALRRHAVRRLGGITGDVLGALVETTTAVVLVVMALG